MRRTVLASLLFVVLAVTGCAQAGTTGPPTAGEPEQRVITQQEAEYLLLPVYEAAGTSFWAEADPATLDPLFLGAFALRDAVLNDLPALCPTIDEIGLLHGSGPEGPPKMWELYADQSRSLETMPETAASVEATDDAGVLALAREHGEYSEPFGFAPAAFPSVEWLVGEYLDPAFSMSVSSPEVTVDESGVVVVTYSVPGYVQAHTVAERYSLRYLVEHREGAWKVVGLDDYAGTLWERDEQMVEYYGFPPMNGLDRWTEAMKEPTTEEALAEFTGRVQKPVEGDDTTWHNPEFLAMVKDDLGTWWAACRIESRFSTGVPGYEGGHVFVTIMHKHPWGWRHITGENFDGSASRQGLPPEVVSRLEAEGVGFSDF